MIYISAIYFFIFALGLSLALMPIVNWLSYHFNVLDFPIGKKKQKKPMPLLGGVAVAVAFAATVIIHLIIKYTIDGSSFLQNTLSFILPYINHTISNSGLFQLLIIMSGGAIIFTIGILDDAIFFNIKKRLISEFVVATIVVALGIKPSLGEIPDFITWPITIIWIVGLTNSFNLIDGMDGMAAGIAFISAMLMAVFCFATDQIMIGFLLVTLCGATLGFLKSNWNPAKIYMGSCGALFLGYMLATIPLTVAFMQIGSFNSAIFMPLVILSVPIYDTISVVFIRLWNKRSPFAPDHNHIFHRIQKLGLTIKQVVLVIYLLCFAVGLSAMFLLYAPTWQASLIIIHIIAMYGVFVVLELTGARLTKRQELVLYEAKYRYADDDKNHKKYKALIRMLTADGAELEVSYESLKYLAIAFAEKREIIVDIIPDENEFSPLSIKANVKSIWRSSEHKGFAGVNFIFTDDVEMRKIKSLIVAIIYPDRKTTNIEEEHKKKIASGRFRARKKKIKET